MTSHLIPEKESGGPDRRHDGPADIIDEAVVLAAVDGVGPALEYMSGEGVPHATALRVLAGPTYHRRPASRTLEKVLKFLAPPPRGKR